jgi:hypothetical protein
MAGLGGDGRVFFRTDGTQVPGRWADHRRGADRVHPQALSHPVSLKRAADVSPYERTRSEIAYEFRNCARFCAWPFSVRR